MSELSERLESLARTPVLPVAKVLLTSDCRSTTFRYTIAPMTIAATPLPIASAIRRRFRGRPHQVLGTVFLSCALISRPRDTARMWNDSVGPAGLEPATGRL